MTARTQKTIEFLLIVLVSACTAFTLICIGIMLGLLAEIGIF